MLFIENRAILWFDLSAWLAVAQQASYALYFQRVVQKTTDALILSSRGIT
jgi:hypothetical protein